MVAPALLAIGVDFLGDHLDALLEQVCVQAGDLLLGDLDLLEGRGDLLEVSSRARGLARSAHVAHRS